MIQIVNETKLCDKLFQVCICNFYYWFIGLNKIHKINAINLTENYSILEKRSPMEMLNDN
jgi:hypothetical protein